MKKYYVHINCDNGALWFPDSEELEQVIGFDDDGLYIIATRLNLSLEELNDVLEHKQEFVRELTNVLNKQYKRYIDEVVKQEDYAIFEEMQKYYYDLEINSVVIRDYNWDDEIVIL